MRLPTPTSALPTATAAPTTPHDVLRAQFTQPRDVMSVLLLLGGDVVQRALAQLSGTRLTPVAFSFGWVTYAVTALFTAVGENKLMPAPDSRGLVVNGVNGYARANNSWVLGRIIRDYEFWVDPAVARAEAEYRASEKLKEDERLGLTIVVYISDPKKTAKEAEPDRYYYSGIVCGVVQLGIAAVPWGKDGDWSILLVTAAGIVFALASGALPQWRAEKYHCRGESTKTVTLTRGNGNNKGCIVIIGNKCGLDLEDLAAGLNIESGMMRTRVYASIMVVLWIALMIVVSGLEGNTWYILSVGMLGMVQNIFVSGAPRTPAAFGIHLTYEETIVDKKVMKALQKLEEKYEYVGRSLLDTYFPGGGLWPTEAAYWKKVDEKMEEKLAAQEAKKLRKQAAKGGAAAAVTEVNGSNDAAAEATPHAAVDVEK